MLSYEDFELGLNFLEKIQEHLTKERAVSGKLLSLKRYGHGRYASYAVMTIENAQASASINKASEICEELSLDASSVAIEESIEVEIHIVLHPTYSIPCPYFRARKFSSGDILPLNKVQLMLNKIHVELAEEELEGEKDHRQYTFGTLMPDMHPILDTPFFTFHICDLHSRIQQLVEVCDKEVDGKRYMLLWLTYVGPFMGITISPRLFKQFSSEIDNSHL